MNLQTENSFRDKAVSAGLAMALVILAVTANWGITFTEAFARKSGFYWILFSEFATLQLVLASIWLVMGRSWFLVRILPSIVIIESCIRSFGIRLMMPEVMALFFILLTIGVVLLNKFKLIGTHATWSSDASAKHQFSLQQLLILITALAVLTAWLNFHREEMTIPFAEYYSIAPICAIYALVTLLGIWTAWGAGRLSIRLLTSVLALLGLSATLVVLGPMPFWEITWNFARQWLFLVPILAAWRWVAMTTERRTIFRTLPSEDPLAEIDHQ